MVVVVVVVMSIITIIISSSSSSSSGSGSSSSSSSSSSSTTTITPPGQVLKSGNLKFTQLLFFDFFLTSDHVFNVAPLEHLQLFRKNTLNILNTLTC